MKESILGFKRGYFEFLLEWGKALFYETNRLGKKIETIIRSLTYGRVSVLWTAANTGRGR